MVVFNSSGILPWEKVKVQRKMTNMFKNHQHKYLESQKLMVKPEKRGME